MNCYRPTLRGWFILLLAILACILLFGCADQRSHQPRIDEHTTITRTMDFSSMLPAIDLLCAVGIAASIAALIWIPIQKWIPLALLTFFGGLIVSAYTVAWLVTWLPYLIGAGFLVGALWGAWHFRSLIMGARAWNAAPENAPPPAAIAKILVPDPTPKTGI
jgi:hypothetical protein